MDIKVDCYSGFQTEEKPKRFWIREKEVKVEKILSSWISPDARCFKVIGDDDAYYTLELKNTTWDWELISFTHASLNHPQGVPSHL